MAAPTCRSGGMADAGDSKSPDPCGRVGSTPTSGTTRITPEAVMYAVPTVEETWRLEDIFASDETFTNAKREVDEALPTLDALAGVLAEGPGRMADVLEAISSVSRRLGRLHAYTSMRSDGDLRVAANQALRQEVELAYTDLSRRTAWLRPEILRLPDGVVERSI